MMIKIIVNKETRMIQEISKRILGNDGENLQDTLSFSFDDEFVNGTARLELIMPDDTTSYLMLTKVQETYQIPVRSVMTKEGKINMQLVITEGIDDEEIPIFKSNVFFVRVNTSINAETIAEEDYPEFIDVAETKLNAMDDAIEAAGNLDVTASKSGTTTTITITHQDETETTVQILDGEKGDKGDKGNTGDPGYTPVKGVDYFTAADIASLNIPDDTSDLTNSAGFITKDVNDLTYYYDKTTIDSKVSSVYKYKGSVSTYADLPSSDLTIGDVYNVESDGSNYAWTGTAWDKLGGTIDLSGKLDISKVKNASSTTAGDVYDVRYINSLIGDISTALDTIQGEVI